ncbi:MAG: hypothetical protein ACK5NF_06380 [Bacilli bacterium]
MLTIIINILTILVLLFALGYVCLKPLSWIVGKLSKKTTNQKLVKFEKQINKINKIVTRTLIRVWLALIVVGILKVVPKLTKNIITKQLGDNVDIINGVHTVMQIVLVVVVGISIGGLIFLLTVKHNDNKKAKNEDTSNNY